MIKVLLLPPEENPVRALLATLHLTLVSFVQLSFLSLYSLKTMKKELFFLKQIVEKTKNEYVIFRKRYISDFLCIVFGPHFSL